MTFQVGDRVVCKFNYDDAPIEGREATVIGLHGYWSVALAFDGPIGSGYGHTCGGVTAERCGWNVPPEYLALVGGSTLSSVERKCRYLWNKSKWVQRNKTLAY